MAQSNLLVDVKSKKISLVFKGYGFVIYAIMVNDKLCRIGLGIGIAGKAKFYAIYTR